MLSDQSKSQKWRGACVLAVKFAVFIAMLLLCLFSAALAYFFDTESLSMEEWYEIVAFRLWYRFCLLCGFVLFPICLALAGSSLRRRVATTTALGLFFAVAHATWALKLTHDLCLRNLQPLLFSEFVIHLSWQDTVLHGLPLYLLTAKANYSSAFFVYFFVEGFAAAVVVMALSRWIFHRRQALWAALCQSPFFRTKARVAASLSLMALFFAGAWLYINCGEYTLQFLQGYQPKCYGGIFPKGSANTGPLPYQDRCRLDASEKFFVESSDRAAAARQVLAAELPHSLLALVDSAWFYDPAEDVVPRELFDFPSTTPSQDMYAGRRFIKVREELGSYASLYRAIHILSEDHPDEIIQWLQRQGAESSARRVDIMAFWIVWDAFRGRHSYPDEEALAKQWDQLLDAKNPVYRYLAYVRNPFRERSQETKDALKAHAFNENGAAFKYLGLSHALVKCPGQGNEKLANQIALIETTLRETIDKKTPFYDYMMVQNLRPHGYLRRTTFEEYLQVRCQKSRETYEKSDEAGKEK